MSKNYATFIDNAGRNLLGVILSETPEVIVVENPVMVLVQPQPQQGSLQVQLIPLFLSEFVVGENGSKNFSFEYVKSQVAIGKNFKIDGRILEQYERIVGGSFEKQKPASSTPEVIKLFE